MKAKISLLTIVVASVVGCANADTAEPVETPSWLSVHNEEIQHQGWYNYGRLTFNASIEGVSAQNYDIYKASVGQVMSVTAPELDYHFIETHQGALLRGVGETGLLTHEECDERIGDIGIAAKAQPSLVSFFLGKGAPLGPSALSAKKTFNINELSNNAEVAIGEATTIEIEGVEGESFPIGPMLELSAPWGASGTITPGKSIEFAFQYFSTTDGQKETVNISGQWSPEMGPMDKFNHEPMTKWLACVTPEVKATLVEQKVKLVGETLEIMTQAELVNGAI